MRIPAVQSNIFHEWKQGCTESVNEYAEDLKCYFLQSIPSLTTKQQESRGNGP